jgi:hypothetical protein
MGMMTMLNDLTVQALMNYGLALLMTGFAAVIVTWSFGRIQQLALAPCRVKSENSLTPHQR